MEIKEEYKVNIGYSAPMSEYEVIQPNEKREWEWCIGGDWFSTKICVRTAPNVAGRFFQKLFLDIHWRKIRDE